MGQRIVAVSDLSGSENDVQAVLLLDQDGTKLTVDLDADERTTFASYLQVFRDAARPARGGRRVSATARTPSKRGRGKNKAPVEAAPVEAAPVDVDPDFDQSVNG